MSATTTSFKKYHLLRLRPEMPVILLAGFSSFLLNFSLCFLFGRYHYLCWIGVFSVAVSAGLFVLSMIVHETFRHLAIIGFTGLCGTDELQKKRSALPNVLGLLALESLLVFQAAPLWECGLASWHSRRCVQAEQYEDALAWADEFVRLAPKSPDAYHRRAAIWLELGDTQNALKDYVRAADVDQTRWDTVEFLLENLLEHGTADRFWIVFDGVRPSHPQQAAQYLRSRSNLPERPSVVPPPAEAEPTRTEPHEPNESGQLVRRV